MREELRMERVDKVSDQAMEELDSIFLELVVDKVLKSIEANKDIIVTETNGIKTSIGSSHKKNIDFLEALILKVGDVDADNFDEEDFEKYYENSRLSLASVLTGLSDDGRQMAETLQALKKNTDVLKKHHTGDDITKLDGCKTIADVSFHSALTIDRQEEILRKVLQDMVTNENHSVYYNLLMESQQGLRKIAEDTAYNQEGMRTALQNSRDKILSSFQETSSESSSYIKKLEAQMELMTKNEQKSALWHKKMSYLSLGLHGFSIAMLVYMIFVAR